MQKIILLGIIASLLIIQPVQAATTTENAFLEYVDQIVAVFLDYLKTIPTSLQTTFEEKVLPIWKKMYFWFEKNIWDKIRPHTKQELERRKEITEKEAAKEKEELMKELSEKDNFFKQVKDFLKNFWTQ